ncbi:type VII secretion system-associated protein [Streptomyces sp. LZ34]
MDTKDPNDKTGKLTMDKAGLQSFLDNRVLPFKDELRKITEDDPTFGPSMGALIGSEDISLDEFDSYQAGKPLALGWMLQQGEVDGQVAKLNKSLATMAENIVEIYEEQAKLFGDIEDNLGTTLETLFATQGGNLISIDGQEFLDIFEDVDDDLGGGSSGGGDDDENE